MKKVVAITILVLGVMSVSCDRQKALDRVLSDPQMKTYIMGEMLKNEQTKAQLADSIFADKQITDSYLNDLVANENSRTDLLNRCLRADTTGDWIIGKLAENPNLAAKMRQIPK